MVNVCLFELGTRWGQSEGREHVLSVELLCQDPVWPSQSATPSFDSTRTCGPGVAIIAKYRYC